MNKVSPGQAYEQTKSNDNGGDNQISVSDRLYSKQSISVKSCLIILVLMSVIMSVSILTIIWVTFFSVTLSDLSNSILKLQQHKLVAYTDQILYQFVLTSETSKNHIATTFTNTSDLLLADKAILPTFRSENTFHSSLIADISLITYDDFGLGYFGKIPQIGKVIYYPKILHLELCILKESGCETYTALDLPAFDHTASKNTIAKKVGHAMFTPTFISNGIPIVFIALVNSNTNSSAPLGFDWFIKLSLSTSSLSNFLKNSTAEISGSIGFIMETSTNYLVATSYPEELGNDNAEIKRTNGTTFNNTDIRNIYSLLDSKLPNFKDVISCNNYQIIEQTEFKMSVYRYCSDYNVDWFIVFAVPQWNYIGNMIIAIICAMTSGIVVIVIGAVLGVYSSLKIVKPFQNLIELFSSVSRMDVEIVESKFKEVFLLQQNFKLMVSKIKQYRAFIPAHLLSQLDNSQEGEENAHKEKDDENKLIEHSSVAESRISRNSNSHSNISHQQSYRPVSNMLFKLGLEKKKVSFCMLYLDGFDHLLQSIDNNELVTVFSEMFELIQKLNGAQIGNFDNQSLILSWNSTTEVKDHEKKALSSSFQLYEKLELLLKKWRTKPINEGMLFDKFSFIMAIHKQESKCGNVGTNTSKNFTIVGSVSNNLSTLIKHAKKLKIPIVASESIISKCNSNMTRFIGEKMLLDEHSTVLPKLSDSEKKSYERIYQVGETNTASMDEWMYELQESERKNKWGEYNKAIKLLDDKQPLQCLNILRDFETKNPKDEPAKYLINKCNS